MQPRNPDRVQEHAPVAACRLRFRAVAFALLMTFGLAGCESHPHFVGSTSALGNPIASDQVDCNGRTIYVHQPDGWRRTINGWEQSSLWGLERSGRSEMTLDELIDAEKESTPAVLRPTIELLRQLSPISIALIQIGLISVICYLGKLKRPEASA